MPFYPTMRRLMPLLALLALAPLPAAAEAPPAAFQIVKPTWNPFPMAKRSDLSVNVGGGKGVVIAPHWVLTAAHCIARRNEGDTTITYPAGVGGMVRIKADRVIRHPAEDIALVRLVRPATGRQPLLLLKDGFPVGKKDQPPYRLRKVSGNQVWDDIPARVTAESGGKRFFVAEGERKGEAGSSGSPWVIHSPLVGDVLVGITHGGGSIPQVGQADDWIQRNVSTLSRDSIVWATPEQALPDGSKRCLPAK